MFSSISYGYWVYLVFIGLVWLVYVSIRGRKQRTSLVIREEATRAGLTEPASLHPVIDPVLCIGCRSCAIACPEKGVLGIIRGKAELIGPTHCIGHGACKEACPVNAITLVFGTERRGVDIPVVRPNFETNVPGIFIAGELGGMGLIRNAITQGRQAVESIRRLDGLGQKSRHDVIIVGAGPAGFAASLAALQYKMRFLTIEQETLGGTVAHYPRGKLVMTAPVILPLVGKMKFTETTKEELLGFWEDVERKAGLKHRYKERVEAIVPVGNGFQVKTTQGSYVSRAILLTIGRRGTPRKLGVPGENLPKVVYRVIDPEQYRGQNVLVGAGGGDEHRRGAQYHCYAVLPRRRVRQGQGEESTEGRCLPGRGQDAGAHELQCEKHW
jgi:thioredoxin reductase